MARTVVLVVNGIIFGASFAAGSEIYRATRGGTKTCTKCLAPVNKNGYWSGEREPRSYSVSLGVDPQDWDIKERLQRRRRCYGCKKSLDPTSVIVLDRAWHRKCVKCTNCDKAIIGPRYYMLNNQIYDQPCFHQARRNPKLQRSQTAVIDLRYPSPLSSDDLEASQPVDSQPKLLHHQEAAPKLTRNYSISGREASRIPEEPGKMSQEMKRKLANDLLSTLAALRVREWRQRTAAQQATIKEEETEVRPASKVYPRPNIDN